MSEKPKTEKGVRLSGLRAEALTALHLTHSIYRKHNEELVITATVDGAFSNGSLHLVGLAFNCSTSNLSNVSAKDLLTEIRAFTSGIDPCIKVSAGPKGEIHVEYDRRVQN